MKAILFVMCVAVIVSCDAQPERHTKVEPELTAQQIADSLSFHSPDSTRTTPGKSFSVDLNGPSESENLNISLWHPSQFKVDADLNYYLPIKLTNKSNYPVIGVSLRRDETSTTHHELGKFKVTLKPHGSATLKLSLQVLRLDKTILNKAWTIGPIVVNEVYYVDGTYSSETITYQ